LKTPPALLLLIMDARHICGGLAGTQATDDGRGLSSAAAH